MGAGVSNWRLAKAVSRLGQLGVVAGTALDQILCRRLQDGDVEGHVRRALDQFPFQKMARRIIDAYFIPGGRKPDAPYHPAKMHTVEGFHFSHELCIAANFVEVFLAKEDHNGLVGINFLEKIQMPHLPSLYGAMLAGVAVVIVGAGIPLEFPNALSALAEHQPASYAVNIVGAKSGEAYRMTFDPAAFIEEDYLLAPLMRPAFLPIISSDVLATVLVRRAKEAIHGFIIEGPMAGGHNAPPRGALKLTEDGQPIYGPRDAVNMDVIREIGLPFWLAGSYGAPDRMKEALAAGASGVQVGTPFALCVESGLTPEFRRELIRKAFLGEAKVFTDPKASPTGFPFKVAELEGTLSEPDVYNKRRRVCDLGFLREAYRREDGSIGYRCAAEPEKAYLAKGGKPASLEGRKCLCNALVSNVGMPQHLADGSTELPLITLGDDYVGIGRFCSAEQPDFTAADVVRTLLGS
ncbi:MAG TPA: 2-nitropropane dioxygenase [Verrucomicrobia bacterium]|nr:MAG: 2-nitropropane dioxygenase [Lentisphaerae bacterium GWF2_57_35]HBA84204.1 2-nitropropane dioxygenase [Verrucomicrobiota bacterium]